jgi:hypothetical protein
MTKEIYILLRNRLKEIAELDEVDWYTGQDEQDGQQEMIVQNGCYIEFMPADFTQLSNMVQQAVIEFDVRLVQDAVYNGEERILDPGLQHLDLTAAIYTKLQGFGAMLSHIPALAHLQGSAQDIVVINDIQRIGIIPDHSINNLLITVQRFRCLVRDVAAVPALQPILATLQLDVHY